MSTFKFTDERHPNSSAVDAVRYNRDEQKVAVTLNSGATYVYDKVPSDAYSGLVDSYSVGRHYAQHFKRNYGPGTYLGYSARFEPAGYKAPDMGPVRVSGVTPKGLTLAPDAKVTGRKVDLVTEVEDVAKRSHKVSFLAGGTLRSHTTQAESVDAAVAELQEFADALGVDFTVKEVTTYFE